MTHRFVCAIALALSGAGCAPVVELRPLDSWPDVPGYRLAAYHQIGVGTRELVVVRVAAQPIRRPGRGAPPRAQLDLRIHNLDRAPITFHAAAAALEVQTVDGRQLECGAPAAVGGEPVIEPGATRRLDLEFLLPPGVGLLDVTGVELTWRLDTGAGPFVRSTPFVRSLGPYPGRYPPRGGWVHPWWCDDPWHVHPWTPSTPWTPPAPH